MNHKPDGGLPLLSARPAVTPATLKRAATNFAARWTETQWVWTVCLRLLPDSVATAIWTPSPSAPKSSTLTTRLPSHHDRTCSSKDMIADRQAHGQTHWQTCSSQYKTKQNNATRSIVYDLISLDVTHLKINPHLILKLSTVLKATDQKPQKNH